MGRIEKYLNVEIQDIYVGISSRSLLDSKEETKDFQEPVNKHVDCCAIALRSLASQERRSIEKEYVLDMAMVQRQNLAALRIALITLVMEESMRETWSKVHVQTLQT